jgi:hypothetical protein
MRGDKLKSLRGTNRPRPRSRTTNFETLHHPVPTSV